MTNTSTRLGMLLPESTDTALVEQLSDALEVVDSEIGAHSGEDLVDIDLLYNGKLAVDESGEKLYMYFNGDWWIVGTGSAADPNKIVTRAGTLTDITDDNGGFQVGSNGSTNVEFSSDTIQSRDDSAVSTLLVNPYGGDVEVGGGDAGEGGVTIAFMRARENLDSNNVSLPGGAVDTWVAGSNPASIAFKAPPSGRVLVIATAQYTMGAGSDEGSLSFDITKTVGAGTGGNADPGGDGRAATASGVTKAPMVVVDICTGLNPGDTYRFRSMHKKSSGSTVTSMWRKIVVQPMY